MPPGPPSFMARSLALARFGVGCHIVPVDGLLRHPCTCPDLETFFHKMLFQHIFPENASQIGLSIPEVTTPLSYQRQRSPKRASESERAIKPGVQGACPRPSFSPFLGRNGDPRRVGGAPGALRPKGASEAPTRRGHTPGPACGAPGRRSQPDHLPMAESAPPGGPPQGGIRTWPDWSCWKKWSCWSC